MRTLGEMIAALTDLLSTSLNESLVSDLEMVSHNWSDRIYNAMKIMISM